MKSGTANNYTKWSKAWGGVRKCFEDKPSLLIGGFNFDLNELPLTGNVLPAGSPVHCDETTRKITPLYLFSVVSVNSGEKTISVKKSIEGTRAKVGMTIIVLGATLATAGTNMTITAINSTDPEYDVLTVNSVASGVVEGAVLAESNKSAVVKVEPNALTPYDVCVDEDAYAVDGEGAWFCDKPVLERRMPVLPKVVKDALLANGCYFRFSARK